MVNADVKDGEKVISVAEILRKSDPVFDPGNRPSLSVAIDLLLGQQNGYLVPFASVRLAHHADIPELNLFRCLFGRDALLITDLLGSIKPELVVNVLLALASVQGAKFDALSEEEPGRIPHEVRELNDPVAVHLMREGNWKFPYYGAVDATLIWLRMLAQVTETNPALLDTEVAGETLSRRAIAASKWLLTRLSSPSGLIESCRSNPQGIQNQVWKDSGDSYMHGDGKLAVGDSTASIETVGETFDAIVAITQIASRRPDGDWPLSESEWLGLAEQVRERLFDLMWLGDRFALGTERDSLGMQIPFDSQASNQGRLLDSEILVGGDFDPYRRAIASALTDSGLLAGSGLRTLSAKHPSYRPGGYHTGSSWPMDGTFAARGLAKHGFIAESHLIGDRIKGAIESIGGYPEFFRSDWPNAELISRSTTIVTTSADLGDHQFYNHVSQPPQLIQGWTVGAYAWLTNRKR